MRLAYFDCFAGISGDMAVGALLDAGVPLQVVVEGLAALGLDAGKITLATRTIVRSQIHATKFDVLSPEGTPVDAQGHHHPHHAADHDHHHVHDHHADEHRGHHHHHGDAGHDHGHHHHDHHHDEHSRDHHSHHHADDPSDDSHHRHHHGDHDRVVDGDHDHHGHSHAHGAYRDIAAMIDGSGLGDGVKRRAKDIFGAIALGEARIHNVPVDDVHFHEVGALDSIADIVAVAICLDHLGVDAVYSSPVPLGSGGMIRTQHGMMPIPTPATLEILKGYPIRLTDIPFELTTPTGAGIIKALSRGTLAMERLRPELIGFGAGTRELPDRPNLLRVVIGDLLDDEERDTVIVVEANIDDMNPQVYPYLIERLLDEGALDVYLTQVLMKKGRPGVLLTVIVPPSALDAVTGTIYRETTTIGLRFRESNRRKLPREEVMVDTEFGPVRMKRIDAADGIRLAPEFEEARRIAQEHSLPLQQVMRRLEEWGRDAEVGIQNSK